MYNATLWGLLQELFLGIFSLQFGQLWISGIFARQKIDEECCNRIQATLDEFHAHKSVKVNADVCRGKGNRPICNWYIPKLGMMQTVVSNVWANGTIIQFYATVMEHAHITEIKNPAQVGNNQHYKVQICCDLNHTDKLHHFKLATTICDPHLRLNYSDANNVDSYLSTATLPLEGPCQSHNYFNKALHLQDNDQGLHPLHTFTNSYIAFHVNCHPSFRQMTIDDVAEKFGLPDLCPNLTDFVCLYAPDNLVNYVIGSWPSGVANTDFNFSKIEVWSSMHMQTKSFHSTNKVMPSQHISACPPCHDWPLGAMIMWLSILTM